MHTMERARKALTAAGGMPPPPPPPRRPQREAGATVPQHEPTRRAPALPPWLLKQRDALFREATSLTESPPPPRDASKPTTAAASSKLSSLDFTEIGHDATENEEPSPRRDRIAPPPPTRDYWGEKWENEGSSVERLAMRVAQDIGSHLQRGESPSVSSSDAPSPGKAYTHESPKLKQALRERELANECVKNLTTEVVRLAGELRAHTDAPILSAAAHRSEASASARVHIASPKQIQQADRRRKKRRMSSALRSWSDNMQHHQQSNRIGDKMARRYQKRYSLSVLQAWDNRVKQNGRVERALESLQGKAAASAFDGWRLRSGTSTDVGSQDTPEMQGEVFKPYEAVEGKLERQKQTRQVKREMHGQFLPFGRHHADVHHYLQHVGIKQMHARWKHRRIHASFRRMQERCRKVLRVKVVLKRSFLTVSARHISKVLMRSLEAFQKLRIRSLRRSRAVEAGRLRRLQAARIIVAAWRGCASFLSDCLHVENDGIDPSDRQEGLWELTSSVQRLKKTLSNLNYDRSSLSTRLNLLHEELSAQAGETPSRALNSMTVARPLQMQGNWHALAAGLERGDVSASIDQTRRDQEEDVVRQAGEQKRIEDVYETLESTLKLQASDIQKLESSCMKAVVLQNTIREELTDVLRSVHDGKTTVEMRRSAITAAVEGRQARQRDTWAAFDALETLLAVAEARQEAEPFVDTILHTPGQSHFRSDTSLVTPAARAAGGQNGEQEMSLLQQEWKSMGHILDDTHDALVVTEFPGISLQLIREHLQDLRAATLSISNKDAGTTEKSLRRLQVNAKLLHIETSQQASTPVKPQVAAAEGTRQAAGASNVLSSRVTTAPGQGESIAGHASRATPGYSTLGAEYWI